MAAAPKDNLGKMPCPCCGEPVALKRSATMKLSFVCDDADCEMSGYANPNTGAARKFLARVVRKPGAAPAEQEPRPEAKPAKPTKPAQEATKPVDPAPSTNPTPTKPPRPAFDLGALVRKGLQ